MTGAELSSRWRARHPDVHKARMKELTNRKRQKLIDLKKAGACSTCGEKDFRCLEWAHKKEGTKRIQIAGHFSLKRLQAELKITHLLCENCHKKKDYAAFLARLAGYPGKNSPYWIKYPAKYKQYRLKRAYIKKAKNGGCEYCQEQDFRTLEFAHKRISPFNKSPQPHMSWIQIKKQIQRCRVLCGNCHAIKDYKDAVARHAQQRKGRWTTQPEGAFK